MIIGISTIPKVVERSICRTSEDYYLSVLADYKIHSNALMPLIQFEKAKEVPKSIDKSIFLNVEETELSFDNQIKTQNYLSTSYKGRIPLEFYGPKTKLGRQFHLVCQDGSTFYKDRYFATSGALTNNADANELIEYEK